jgi:rod shape-determining protein MreD
VTFLKFLLGLGAALAAHSALVALMPQLVLAFDPFLVVSVLTALGGNSLGGLAGGLVAGFARDTLSGRLYGLHGFADTIIGYATARTAQRMDLQQPGAVWVVTVLATLVQQAILVCLSYLLLPRPEVAPPLWVPIQAIVNGFVAMTVWSVASRAQGFRQRAERRKMDRLRL